MTAQDPEGRHPKIGRCLRDAETTRFRGACQGMRSLKVAPQDPGINETQCRCELTNGRHDRIAARQVPQVERVNLVSRSRSWI